MGQWMRDNAVGIGIYGQNAVFPLGPKLDRWEEHLSMGQASLISGLEYALTASRGASQVATNI